jgi:hypothetical protein
MDTSHQRVSVRNGPSARAVPGPIGPAFTSGCNEKRTLRPDLISGASGMPAESGKGDSHVCPTTSDTLTHRACGKIIKSAVSAGKRLNDGGPPGARTLDPGIKSPRVRSR